ncbi:MAG: extracellular protein [Bacteroidetes bacterium HLUCCA01]|nr:MAG: extracellular protein [Bacteroidetes bacterium HLUCCA01]
MMHPIFKTFTTCTLAILIAASTLTANDSPFLMYYWSFNNETTFTTPDIGLDGAGLEAQLAGLTELTTGDGQDFSGLNARNGDPAGTHLRFNNPVGSSLTFSVPTTGFENIVFKYETRRSNSGANTQFITYTLDGQTYQSFRILEVTTVPTLITLDFSSIDGAANNPDFAVRFEFNDSNNPPNLAGNNRFDNVTVEGTAQDGVNLPPVLANPLNVLELSAGNLINTTSLASAIFEDPDQDPLTFTIQVPQGAPFSINYPNGPDAAGILSADQPGEDTIVILADDGTNTPVSLTLRVLVYPAPADLSARAFSFTQWSQDAPGGTYPEHMIFLQSAMDDPGVYDDLLYAYNLTADQYNDVDLLNIGFPYRNTSRTRINGLGERGISFINTGRGRDLGGALVSLDTRDVNRATFDFKAGTEELNSRVYAMRVQYRVVQQASEPDMPATYGAWQDLTLPLGEAIEYNRSFQGQESQFQGLDLPPEALGQQEVHLLFRYYFTGIRLDELSGARDKLRLDDIEIADLTGVSAADEIHTPGAFSLEQNYPNPFNPTTTIGYTLSEPGPVRISVYNSMGQQVAVLTDATMPAGSHRVRFDASGLSSGMYVYRMETGDFSAVRSMLLIR